MLNEIISDLVAKLNESLDERDIGDPYFDKKEYHAYPFVKGNFHKIDGCTASRKMVFIDGGNQELLGAPNFSIQLNRIYFNIFKGTNRITQTRLPHKIEFFSITYSILKNDKIQYETSTFPINEEWKDYLPSQSDLSFSSKDRTVTSGTMRDDLQRVASISRRFAEWKYSSIVVERLLTENDILIIDGTLQTAFTNEDKYIGRVKENTTKNGVIFSGLSKSSSLFTTTGLSLLGSLFKLTDDWKLDFGTWYYYPIAEGLVSGHSAIIFILKLHERANHIFRYEVDKEQVKRMNEAELYDVFSNLAGISLDATLPGYPYGLIDADDNARVRNNEIETYRIMVLSELSKRGLWNKFARHIRSTDAHEILNLLKE